MTDEHRLSWRRADVIVDPDGAVAVSRCGQPYVVGYGPRTLVIDTKAHQLGAPQLETLPDEVNLRWDVDVPCGRLEISVRHSFGPVWGQRWVMRNHGERPAQVDELIVPLTPVAGAVHWLFEAGAETSLSVQPLDPTLPLLGLWVQHGEVWGAGPTRPAALNFGRRLVSPHAGQVIDVSADFFPTAAAFARTVHRWLPAGTYVRHGEPVRIRHLDAALTRDVTSGKGRECLGGHSIDDSTDDERDIDQEVSEFVEAAGTQRELEFHDARGRTELVLHWAVGLESAFADEAAALLSGPRAANGVARLPDPTAGLVVQRAIAQHAEIDPDEAADALDLLAAQPAPPADPSSAPDLWAVLFSCGEFQRTGDAELLDRAVRDYHGLGPRPGAGVAATRLAVALLTTGHDPTCVLQRLARYAEESDDLLTRCELLLVAGSTRPPATRPVMVAEVTRAAVEVSAGLGSGLLGRGVPDAAPEARARSVFLLTLMLEPAASWQDRLAQRPGSMLRNATHRIVWDLQAEAVPGRARRSALLWLGLAADADA